ncbi:MAG: hypothetical protein WC346_02825 [Methanogenium sp.]|jgi:hypothetical protein
MTTVRTINALDHNVDIDDVMTQLGKLYKSSTRRVEVFGAICRASGSHGIPLMVTIREIRTGMRMANVPANKIEVFVKPFSQQAMREFVAGMF